MNDERYFRNMYLKYVLFDDVFVYALIWDSHESSFLRRGRSRSIKGEANWEIKER